MYTSDAIDTTSAIPEGYGLDDIFHCDYCSWEGQGYQLIMKTGECPVCLKKKIIPGRHVKKTTFTHILSKVELKHLSKEELVLYIYQIELLCKKNSYTGTEISDEDFEVEASLVEAREMLETKK